MYNSEDSILTVKGVGKSKAELLAKLGINTVEDLVFYFPRTYEDRKNKKKIIVLSDGEKETFDAVVAEVCRDIRIRNNLTITKVKICDESGAAYAVWYNCPFIKNSLQIGSEYTFNGKVSRKYNKIEISAPVFEKTEIKDKLNVGIIAPVYPLTEKINNKFLRKIIFSVLQNININVEDFLPENIKKELNLCELGFAAKHIHFPESYEMLQQVRRRLVFDELFLMQMGLLWVRRRNDKLKGIKLQVDDSFNNIIEKLPFKLTNAQNKVIKEIISDIEDGNAMNRLVQGDVGSGKTIIAILSLIITSLNGLQGAFMVPTEVLAIQHFEAFKSLIEAIGLNIRLQILTGSTKPKEKTRILEELKNGTIDIIIGTHSLIEDNVEFKNLAFVVTDEQHRFGVRQRANLIAKGVNPHCLFMTATPIPRTLSLILYGDVDISIINELPPGRKEVKTYYVNSMYKQRMFNFIKSEIDKGRQVFFVCPLVEESEVIDAKSVLEIQDEISSEFSNYNVAILHGKMNSKDKADIMEYFKKGDIDILISTTVIEVGVNVPNASIMVVQNSERFGLAQLHQLRGRVGRGGYQSHCILISDSRDKNTVGRLKLMCSTNDGFVISEKDLEFRGPGDFFGTRQHGVPELRIANLFSDKEELKIAQDCALNIIKLDPELKLEKHQNIREKVLKVFDSLKKD